MRDRDGGLRLEGGERRQPARRPASRKSSMNFRRLTALTPSPRAHRFFSRIEDRRRSAPQEGDRGALGAFPLGRALPRLSGLPARDLRFPSCELCHWPAVGVGRTHVWRCASCRHVNEHGSMRPLLSVALLRLATVDAAALRLEVADTRYGHVLAPPLRPVAQRPRIRPRANAPGIGSRRPAPRMVRRRVRVGRGRPVYARAAVGGLPVLIIGGDRPYPRPLGANEPPPGRGSLGSRATRIACPCRQPSPCVHAQALYAHVVSLGAGQGACAPPAPAATAATGILRREGRPVWSPRWESSGRPEMSAGPRRCG